MEWTQNEKGNWIVSTPSSTSLVVFKRHDEWSWSATRKYQDKAVFSQVAFSTAEDAQEDVMSRVDMSAPPPPQPTDYFNYEAATQL